MTKKKGKDAKSAGAVNAARRAGETFETKQEAYRGSRVICHNLSSTPQTIIEIDFFSTALIPLSLVVECTVRGKDFVEALISPRMLFSSG